MRVKTKPIESREEKTKAITKPKTREERAHALYITVQTIQSKIWDDWAENVFRVSCQKLHQLMNWRPTPWSSGGTLNEKNEIYFQQALWLTWPWRILIMAPVVSQDHHTLLLSFFYSWMSRGDTDFCWTLSTDWVPFLDYFCHSGGLLVKCNGKVTLVLL